MKKNFFIIAFVLMSIALMSCTAEGTIDNMEVKIATEDEKSMKMNFSVNFTDFSGDGISRRAAWAWNDSAVVYIRFYRGTSTARGHAVFNKMTNSWEAYWNGNIGEADKCEVYFFEDASTSDLHRVVLDETKAIYADKEAYYEVRGSEMIIQANLTPLSSRIRFAGSSGLGIEVEGLKYYTCYDADNNQWTTSTAPISGNVTTDGYTPYYYCVFADNNRQLTISNSKDGDEIQFLKSFTSSVLKVGESGYITIPTDNANKGWEVKLLPMEQNYTVTNNGNSVSFKMKRVKNGSFLMGSEYRSDSPVHRVTLTKNYYIGETEVTQALWYAVMGQKPNYGDYFFWKSEYGLGDNYPAYCISYEDCEQFLAKLNLLTGQAFRFPTEAEWEFAARGGNLSKGYRYSGSNYLDDVTWYEWDLTPDDEGFIHYYGTHAHRVKTKAANELGLYDMTGNVEEWNYDWYDTYPSTEQTDPTGPAVGTKRIMRGGSWFDSNRDNYQCYARCGIEPSSITFFYGFRLALTAD